MSSLLWSEKYSPSSLDELIADPETKTRLGKVVESGEMPHLLFSGPVGSGKLSAARCVAKAVLQDKLDGNYLEIFATDPLTPDERKQATRMGRVSSGRLGSAAGKSFTFPKFIQVRVKPFVEVRSIGAAPFRILIIHDFHVLNNQQQGFRRLMETYGGNCRMILVTPYISNIIDPILSRTQTFIFRRPNRDEFGGVVRRVASSEGIEVDSSTINTLYDGTEGYLGLSLDALQICTNNGNKPSPDDIFDTISSLKPPYARTFFKYLLDPNFANTRKKYRELTNKGRFSRKEFFTSLAREVYNLPLDPTKKAQIVDIIAREDFRSTFERTDDVHASSLLTKLSIVLGGDRNA
ncbi:MAG: hypothetical protein ACTSU5_16525 [Promethearchaeota archaeon]